MSADGAQKIAIVIKPLLDALEKNLSEKQVAISQELLIEVGKLRAAVELLQLQQSEKKKPIARETKPKAEAGAGAAAEPEAGAAAVVAQPSAVTKNFAVNKFVYFRDQYKNNAAYREKYVNAELRALIDADPLVKGKANEAQRLIAEATFCWNFFKDNQKDVIEAANKEFDAAKLAHENNNKPPQQTAENHTPI